MKKLILLSLLIVGSFYVTSQENSGTIYYENGNTLVFKKLTDFFNKPDVTHPSSYHKEIAVIYNGTVRKLKFDQIKEFKILEYKLDKKVDGVFYVLTRVKTKTEKTLQTKYKFVLYLKVEILDDLTGELIEQRVNFSLNSKLNIRKIVFD